LPSGLRLGTSNGATVGKNGKRDSEDNKVNGNAHAVARECLRLGRDCDYEKELRRLQIELVKLQEWAA
jgi:hypothetical protein